MEKLVKQAELIENIPKEALDLAYLINFKIQVDKVLTKAKISLLLDNLKALENVLKLNEISNDILKREIEKLKEKLYRKQEFFKEQELLKGQ